jgi:hypothetical protein
MALSLNDDQRKFNFYKADGIFGMQRQLWARRKTHYRHARYGFSLTGVSPAGFFRKVHPLI